MTKLEMLNERLYKKTYESSNGENVLQIKKGRPDARFSTAYKYYVVCVNNNHLVNAYKTLKEIEETVLTNA